MNAFFILTLKTWSFGPCLSLWVRILYSDSMAGGSKPIFQFQALYSSEFFEVICYKGKIVGNAY